MGSSCLEPHGRPGTGGHNGPDSADPWDRAEGRALTTPLLVPPRLVEDPRNTAGRRHHPERPRLADWIQSLGTDLRNGGKF